jgi:hypothetical protein
VVLKTVVAKCDKTSQWRMVKEYHFGFLFANQFGNKLRVDYFCEEIYTVDLDPDLDPTFQLHCSWDYNPSSSALEPLTGSLGIVDLYMINDLTIKTRNSMKGFYKFSLLCDPPEFILQTNLQLQTRFLYNPLY